MILFWCKRFGSPEPLPNGNTGKELCAQSLENYVLINDRPTWLQSSESPTTWPPAHRRQKTMARPKATGQPMIDSELGLTMVFNGAIYNYPELREELKALGYRFFSDGDTEVLLKGYHAWGSDLLPKLNGMFAFAIWERDRQQLFIARDRLGVKPLYLSRTNERLRFASSLPALMAGGDIGKTLDPVALNHYLNFHAVVPAPRTLLAGVEKLAPASWMRIDAQGNCEQKTWWNLNFGPQP